jgi:transposase-like protein
MQGEIQCIECKSFKVVKSGYIWKKRTKIQRYRCNDCGKLFSTEGKLN